MPENLSINSSFLAEISQSDKVRSDIRYHLCMESPLKHVVSVLKISDEELDELLKDIDQKEKTEKKRRFGFGKSKSDAATFVIRRIVLAHIHLLYAKAKLQDFKEKIEEEIAAQHDIDIMGTEDPSCLNKKALPPKQALATLNNILDQTKDELKKIKAGMKSHEESIKAWIESIQAELENFLQNTKNANNIRLADAITKDQQLALLRVISGVSPDSLLEPLPGKDSPNARLANEIRRIVKRGK